MAGMLIILALQLGSGAAGGFVFARMTGFSLGRIGDMASGAMGGAIGGQLLQGLIPALAGGGASGAGLDVGSLLGQLAIGGVSGAIFAVLAGLLVNPIKY